MTLIVEAKEALEIVKKDLIKIGIDDSITIKVKTSKRKNWCGMYRSFTQFSSRPIFWINENFRNEVIETEKEWSIDGEVPPNIDSIVLTNLIQTIIHEYAHVIAEYFSLRMKDIYRELIEEFEDEEDFAEGFIGYIENGDDYRYAKYINEYVTEVF